MSPDLLYNIYAELFGIALSIPLSVFIAYYLDRLSEARLFRRSLNGVFLITQNTEKEIIDNLTAVSNQTLEPWRAEVATRMQTQEKTSRLRFFIENFIINYASFLSNSQYATLEKQLKIAQQLEISLGLTSALFFQSVKKKSVEQIIDEHAKWVARTFEGSYRLRDEFLAQFPFLKHPTPTSDMSGSEIEAIARKIFLSTIPYKVKELTEKK